VLVADEAPIAQPAGLPELADPSRVGERHALSEVSDERLADPAAIVGLVPPDALGAWNATATGQWVRGDDWAVVDVELVSEQPDEAFDSTVRKLLAVFRTEAGLELAVWPASWPETLAEVLGHDPWSSTEGWQPFTFWHGE
jgi:hypothetical protein